MSEFQSITAIMFWVRKIKVQEFLETIWAQAFVNNDECIKEGFNYKYDFNWESNIATIIPYNENGENFVTITHNLKLYTYAFDVMKEELMAVFGNNILPEYLKEEVIEEDYTYLTNLTQLRHNKNGLLFTYFDNLDKKDKNGNSFQHPEFYYWYKHSSIYDAVWRDNMSINIPNFMEKIYYTVCQKMDDYVNINTTNKMYLEHIKTCFHETFRSAKYLDELMTQNKDILNFYEDNLSDVS